MDDFELYFKDISQEFKQGQTTELTFRSYLKKFIERLFPDLKLSEENKQIRKIGRPDFTCFRKSGIKIGYIETKDIGIDLDREIGGEQIKKYSEGAIPNIILTDYMRFILYKDQKAVLEVKLFDQENLKKRNADINDDKIRKFKQLVETFSSYNLPTIKNATELAIELSKRAKLLRELGKEQLGEDIRNPNGQERSSIYDFYEAFRELMKDADVDECIDAYSQTITYGLFLAKIGSNNRLNRDTASSYIPSSIKIIKKIFNNITGDALPSNLSWIVDEIIDILNSADINKILSGFVFEGGIYKDPFIHFYQDFLNEYDPAKRKHLGVYYTPEPVVSFITNSINHILKKEFEKSNGFADDSVKSLDFATGTGTFLANSFALALKEIRKSGLGGIEKEKIKNHLLKDFYGFEILVSPYVIAHLKLEVLLKEEGYNIENNERVQVYLTNTLNDPNETINTLIGFMKELSYETMMANLVKKEKPILVVMGNPPYSGMSANNGEWINNILKNGYTKPNGTKDEGYYFVDGKPLGERNPKWLQNDYVKFIRFAQWKIDKSGEGIVGIITSHSYLDNPTFRGMRQSLMKSFNIIYILNLHGNSRKKEKSPDGTKDENVFDIQEGVSIALFIKNKKAIKKQIFYSDIYGNRAKKYLILNEKMVNTIDWIEIQPKTPYYLFIPRNAISEKKYSRYWKITDIFPMNSVGIVTSRDEFVIDKEKEQLINRIRTFADKKISSQEIKQRFNLKSTSNWDVEKARNALSVEWVKEVHRILYRPFDYRWIIYDNAVIERSRKEIMQNMLKENLGLITVRQVAEGTFNHAFVTDGIIESRITLSNKGIAFIFPLYVYDSNNRKQPNFNKQFIDFIKEIYDGQEIMPNQLFYYIYAILYSQRYRTNFSEFLSIDFPRIPFVKDYKTFNKLSKLGNELIEIHLGRRDFSKNMTRFDISGSNIVNKVEYKNNKVYINDTQFFENVPKNIWDFWIGGYQILDKWLKSRKGDKLSYQEIELFVKIVSTLNETIKLMEEIDKVYINR